ncbi:Protein kinase-like domain protein [Colletotrichum tofieldiae]|nr:Protein kinase-like domain protein [Colletotrichum tofieldiae]
MVVDVNHAGFERRLSVVQQLLHGRGLQASIISTLAYDEEYAYPFNNFLFKVELATPAFASSFPGTQPGTCKAPPEGVSTLVIKLSNLAAHDVNNTNRVENDVASQHLVRKSMEKSGLDPLIPDVYAWAPATTTDQVNEEGFGWIMSEFRSGVDLGPEFSSLDMESQKHVLEQMAAVLGAMQAADLPQSVTKFGGGLKFDPNGAIVSGESSSMQDVRPTGSYAEWRIEKLRSRFKQAAESSVIQGWESNGVAARIEKFLASGGPEKVLIAIYNMLFDKKAKKVTAVLDFDFASVSHPFEEFISMSFSHTGGNVGDDDTAINQAILSGDFTTPPADLDKESLKEWELAKTWNSVLQESVALAPFQIDGVNQIRDLMRLQRFLCPYWLGSASVLEELDEVKRAELRVKAEADLVGWLKKHGY